MARPDRKHLVKRRLAGARRERLTAASELGGRPMLSKVPIL